MSASEISHLMELNKKKAELDFKKGYFVMKGMKAAEPRASALDAEIADISQQVSALEKKVAETGRVLFYPNEDAMLELGSELGKFKPEEIYAAVERKTGDVYAVFEKKGLLVKENFERRKEVAALIEYANSLPEKIRTEIIGKVKAGQIGKLDASTLEEKKRERLFRLLNRCGITCFLEGHMLISENRKGTEWKEVKVQLNGSHVWVDRAQEEEVMKFGKELVETGNLVQLRNAERQVKKFTPDEEKQFRDLQNSYLTMIRRRDSLLEG